MPGTHSPGPACAGYYGLYFTDSSVWNTTLELPPGDYYIVLRDLHSRGGGGGWTESDDVEAGNTPQLVVYSKNCHQYVGSYTFGATCPQHMQGRIVRPRLLQCMQFVSTGT
jgi:hypothetical protein